MKRTIRALIVDDETKSREILQWVLEKYCPQVEVVRAAPSVTIADKMIQQYKPDLVFLDVEMPHANGFDLLDQQEKINFEIIFISAHDHYALKAIKYNPIDYLLKPLDINELIKAVARMESQMVNKIDAQWLDNILHDFQNENKEQKQIAITQQDGREIIPVDQIIYCKADGTCTWFMLKGGRKILSSKNLGEYEKVLPVPNGQLMHRFFRVHYSCIVNLGFIQKFNRREKCLEMKDGTKIAIAQRRGSRLKEILQDVNLL